MEKLPYFDKQPGQINAETRKFIHGQHAVVSGLVTDLGIKHIFVSPEPEVMDAQAFVGARTIGFTGAEGIPLALAVGSDSARQDGSLVSALFVTPTPDASGILVDDRTGRLWTDSFWLATDRKLRFVKPTQPIPLDGINLMYDSMRTDRAFESQTELKRNLRTVTNDKHYTKEILDRAGVPTPKGILITHDLDVQREIDRFLTQYPEVSGLVHKPLRGAHGDGVKMVRRDERDKLIQEVWDSVHRKHTPRLVEERIVPPQLAALRRLVSGVVPTDEIDYNFRVLVHIDRDHASVLDSEVRYALNEDNPVNITNGHGSTRAVRMAVLGNQSLVDRIYATASLATQAIATEVLRPGEKTADFAGVDIMLDPNGNPIVLEVNAGEYIGGYGTLSQIDHDAPESIRSRFLPAITPYLDGSFQTREPARNLRRLPLNESDRVFLTETAMEGNDYRRAEELLITLDHRREGYAYIVTNMLKIAKQTRDFTPLETYLRGEMTRWNDPYLRQSLEQIQNLAVYEK